MTTIIMSDKIDESKIDASKIDSCKNSWDVSIKGNLLLISDILLFDQQENNWILSVDEHSNAMEIT